MSCLDQLFDNTFNDVLFVVASVSLSLNFIGSPLLSRRLASKYVVNKIFN